MGEKPRWEFTDRAIAVVGSGPVDRALRGAHPGASWSDVRRLVRTGKVLLDGAVVLDPAAVAKAGSTISIKMRAARPALSPAARDLIVHADAYVVVVRKPAGI